MWQSLISWSLLPFLGDLHPRHTVVNKFFFRKLIPVHFLIIDLIELTRWFIKLLFPPFLVVIVMVMVKVKKVKKVEMEVDDNAINWKKSRSDLLKQPLSLSLYANNWSTIRYFGRSQTMGMREKNIIKYNKQSAHAFSIQNLIPFAYILMLSKYRMTIIMALQTQIKTHEWFYMESNRFKSNWITHFSTAFSHLTDSITSDIYLFLFEFDFNSIVVPLVDFFSPCLSLSFSFFIFLPFSRSTFAKTQQR